MPEVLWIDDSFVLPSERPTAAVLRPPFAEADPAVVIEECHRRWPGLPVIVLQPAATLAEAVRLAHAGAHCVLAEESELKLSIDNTLRATAIRRPRTPDEPWRRLLVGVSPAMDHVAEVIRLVARRRSTVLVTGETGTGKEMAARAIHAAGVRAAHPLVSINCSALPENLLEAELFGHVRGAFTGALSNRTGRFEMAHGGTIFLDEIGDMPMDLQSKLLRVLQERAFERLGSSETVKVDVRVIAATNVDLLERVREGRFREDLFYRLNVVPLSLPPLRERKADIALLSAHFIEKVCLHEGLPVKQLSPETIARLERYDWPGNVRQLENAVEMAVALSGDRMLLYPGDFPLPSTFVPKAAGVSQASVPLPDHGLDFEQTIGAIELSLLEQALRRTSGNKTQAADLLNLNRTTLNAKLKSLGALAKATAG
ncbi:MAG: sigma-54 dependent transcriptional regulator [Acidobacteria bacterium]|nr:sigma-54 dependent transcriptional regulator [Acidobacteriota bacterium]